MLRCGRFAGIVSTQPVGEVDAGPNITSAGLAASQNVN